MQMGNIDSTQYNTINIEEAAAEETQMETSTSTSTSWVKVLQLTIAQTEIS